MPLRLSSSQLNQVKAARDCLSRLVATRWEARFAATYMATLNSAAERRKRKMQTLADWFLAHKGDAQLVVPSFWAKAQELIKGT